jgi:acetyltransferase
MTTTQQNPGTAVITGASSGNGAVSAALWSPLNGPPVTIRPIAAEDLARIRSFVQRLSAETGFQRLMSPRKPTEEELRRWTFVDGVREVALVAAVREGTGERLAGVVRYVRDDAIAEAEFAIVLADDWQKRGLGKELLRRLIACARQQGVVRIVGMTLSTNLAMRSLAKRLGFRSRRSPDSASLKLLELPLTQ